MFISCYETLQQLNTYLKKICTIHNKRDNIEQLAISISDIVITTSVDCDLGWLWTLRSQLSGLAFSYWHLDSV